MKVLDAGGYPALRNSECIDELAEFIGVTARDVRAFSGFWPAISYWAVSGDRS